MDHIDNFRVSEMDLIKWEKSCKALNGADSALTEGPIGPALPSKEMRGIAYVIQRLRAQFPLLRFLLGRACRDVCITCMPSAVFLSL